MDFKDLARLYESYRKKFGSSAPRHISQLLKEAKRLHKIDWDRNPTVGGDHEQSWRAFKGKNLEKLIFYIIKEEVENLGLGIVEGNKLEKTNPRNLGTTLNLVYRKLLVRFGKRGEFGCHLPDVDLVIFRPNTSDIIAVISSKVTLRERIAQTGYWKLKLLEDPMTSQIRVFFVTPDEDSTLTTMTPPKKGRAIVEVDTDGTYVTTEQTIEESSKVKSFDKLIADLKSLL